MAAKKNTPKKPESDFLANLKRDLGELQSLLPEVLNAGDQKEGAVLKQLTLDFQKLLKDL